MLTACCTLLALCAMIFAGEPGSHAGSPQPQPVETAKLHVFKVPKSCLHSCQDPNEALRRFNESKAVSTADVYAITGAPASRCLTPILKCVPIQSIGGGTEAEPSAFGVNVTAAQKAAMEAALAKNELFIIYYHFGW